MKNSFCLALGFTCVLMAQAGDFAGSKDHPLITRYPGSVIEWYTVDNHRPYRIPLGPVTSYRKIDKWLDVQGQVTRIYYALDTKARTHEEVYRNYRDALAKAGCEILAEGLSPAGSRSTEVGSLQWRHVLFGANEWGDRSGAVNEMMRGSATSGGGGTIIARKANDKGLAYVLISVYQFREDRIGTLIDIVETAELETGLVTVDPEAIGKGLREQGRVVLDGLFFDFDKATLKPESKPALTQIAAFLKGQPERNFYVVGHTDGKGELAYNLALSADRARAVVEALATGFGIDRKRLLPHGVGPLVPVAANSSDPGRERNRRVELVER